MSLEKLMVAVDCLVLNKNINKKIVFFCIKYFSNGNETL